MIGFLMNLLIRLHSNRILMRMPMPTICITCKFYSQATPSRIVDDASPRLCYTKGYLRSRVSYACMICMCVCVYVYMHRSPLHPTHPPAEKKTANNNNNNTQVNPTPPNTTIPSHRTKRPCASGDAPPYSGPTGRGRRRRSRRRRGRST